MIKNSLILLLFASCTIEPIYRDPKHPHQEVTATQSTVTKSSETKESVYRTPKKTIVINDNQSKQPISNTNDQNSIDTTKLTPQVVQQVTPPQPKVILSKKLKNYCALTDKYFKKYNWGLSNCESIQWNHVRNSHLGNPIVWTVFGKEPEVETDPTIPLKNQLLPETTLIMCAVHGDEITPVKFCYDLIKDIPNHLESFKNQTIVIAPLVSPDSFFQSRPTRTNARKVDVNRNFPTQDWTKDAHRKWRGRYKSDPRRNPGPYAMSEQETRFQVNLIKRYRPSKIISVHAPLTLLDYDGPSFKEVMGAKAKKLLLGMSHKAGKYRISNYPFFPGSLGNWAGNENEIPTYTLELPSSDSSKSNLYFQQFQSAIYLALNEEFHPLTN